MERDRRRRTLLSPVQGASLLPASSARSCRSCGSAASLRARSAPTSSFGAPGPAGELRVIDYKTGERDRALEEAYFVQLREYRDILSEAWRVPVRGILWYVESGASFEVS